MTLHVAFFVHEFPTLSETFVLNQVTGLLDLGCDVHIFAMRRPPDQAVTHPDVERYRLTSRVTYNPMPGGRLRRLAAAIPVLWRRLREDRRQTLRALDVSRFGRAAFSLELLFWLDRLSGRRRDFDAIYCHFGIVGRLAAFLRDLGGLRGPLVTVFHGVDMSASLLRSPSLYRHLFSNGDLFMPISRRWRTRLIDHGCNPHLIDVHHMGVQLSRFRFEARHERVPGASLKILTIGRLVEKKGIEYALRAIVRARERGVELHYTVIGDGPLRGSLETLTDRLGLNRAVTFAGWQDQDVVAEQILRNDVLLAPSVTDRNGDQEGIPVTLMEAMASGLTVLSTRHSGIPELVEDGKSGLLADERDVEGLADALVRLDREEGLFASLRTAGRQTVAREFDVTKLNARLFEIFRYLGADDGYGDLSTRESGVAGEPSRSLAAHPARAGH